MQQQGHPFPSPQLFSKQEMHFQERGLIQGKQVKLQLTQRKEQTKLKQEHYKIEDDKWVLSWIFRY